MRKLLIGLLGYTFVSQQMVAQTDSIASTHELKNVVVRATNGINKTFILLIIFLSLTFM